VALPKVLSTAQGATIPSSSCCVFCTTRCKPCPDIEARVCCSRQPVHFQHQQHSNCAAFGLNRAKLLKHTHTHTLHCCSTAGASRSHLSLCSLLLTLPDSSNSSKDFLSFLYSSFQSEKESKDVAQIHYSGMVLVQTSYFDFSTPLLNM